MIRDTSAQDRPIVTPIRDTSATDRPVAAPVVPVARRWMWPAIGAAGTIAVVVLIASFFSSERSVDAGRLRIVEVTRGTLVRDAAVNGRVVAAVSPTLYAPSNALVPFHSTKHSGMGLGLTLAREIAEAHGGRIALGNRERGGLSVALVLPVEQVSNSSPRREPGPTAATRPGGPRL